MNQVVKQNGKMSADAVEAIAQQILNGLMQNAPDPTIRTTIEFSKETSKIIIPEGMSKLEAANDLKNQWDNEEQEQAFEITLEGWDWKDGLRAFRNVVEDKFGWLKGKSDWWSTPTEISIVTGYQNGIPQNEMAFYGKVKFPAWEDCPGEVGVNKAGFVWIGVMAKKKYSSAINTFFKEVQQYLKNNSIYRGKPVVVTVENRFGGTNINLEITELKKNPKIILNIGERSVVDNLIIDQLTEEGKACYLFTGTYGNGKTETALEIGIEANKRDITFFYLKDSKHFDKVLAFARKYEPCILFVEDIDEIAAGENRDEKMNAILNTLDGVQTKGRNVKVIFTTNHEKSINKALRRPGRIDLIINFSNPEKDTVRKIFEKYFEGLDGADEIDYEMIGAKAPDAPGAVIAEIAKRGVVLSKKDGQINTNRVLAALTSMEHHIKFMNDEVDKVNKVEDAFNTIRDFLKGDLPF